MQLTFSKSPSRSGYHMCFKMVNVSLVMLLCASSISNCVRGYSEKVKIIRERLSRLETRYVEDIALLRNELHSEIGSIEDRIAEAHDSRFDDIKRSPNMDETNDENKLLEMETAILSQIQTLKQGFAQEKRQRRDLQSVVDQLKSDEEELVDIFNNLTKNVSSSLMTMAANGDIKDEMKKIVTILEQLQPSSQKNCDESIARVRNCYDWLRQGHVTSGVYTIYPDVLWRPLEVYCDMETEGGGWTVIQRRHDGSENFYRPWMDYRFGFGNVSGEFWLGNEFIHRLTSDGPHELRIDLEDFENQTRYAKYSLFSIGPVDDLFRLSFGHFQGGTARDSLSCTHHVNKQFSTYDKGPSQGCSKSYKGGFWYGACHCVNINGLYLKGEHESHANGVNWSSFRGSHYSLKKTEMKIRPM